MKNLKASAPELNKLQATSPSPNPTSSQPLNAQLSSGLPDITVFQHRDFNTRDGETDGWSYRTSLDILYIGDDWNDEISSFIVHSGVWKMYKDRDFNQPYAPEFGPGYYGWVPDHGVENDQVSSFRAIAL